MSNRTLTRKSLGDLHQELQLIGWKRPGRSGEQTGWRFNEDVYGTICIENGLLACYPERNQISPSAMFDSALAADAFMRECQQP